VLRRIGDPVVAAAPAAIRIRTRIHPTVEEAAALTAIGEFLGSVYRSELAGRISLGRLDHKAHAEWRVERKKALTAVSSSRWAGAITRAVEDQYQLGMRGLAAHVGELRSAVQVLQTRCGLRPGEFEPVVAVETDPHSRGSRRRRQRGYRSASERFAKTRRLAALSERLTRAEAALAVGHPSIAVGGKRLWRIRNHLDAAEMAEPQWRDRWDASRAFFTADGESSKRGGNETIRVDDDGRLRIKTPAALANQLGSHVAIKAPIQFGHRGDEWAARVSARRAVRYDISYDPDRDRWYLDASWTTNPEPPASLTELRVGPVLGVDLNSGHLACCVLDASGNPIGEPHTIEMVKVGSAASRCDGRLRAAITMLLDHAQHTGCTAIVIENLDFADARATGRETLGRGTRGRRLRHTVASIPTRRFRDRLIAMATRRGLSVIGVDPAYTSKWGRQHWTKPLQHQAFDPAMVTGHHGAAAAIGRRGLGLAIRRRPAGPRTRQRTSAGTPPVRPDLHRSHGGRRGSSGPPIHRPRGVSVHRKTRAASGQDRSGRTGFAPAQ
jgi:IS605 OrfB family transposase